MMRKRKGRRGGREGGREVFEVPWKKYDGARESRIMKYKGEVKRRWRGMRRRQRR